VPVRIGSGRSQARLVAEVRSGSEKHPHSTLYHSQEQKYTVTHFGQKVPEKGACWSSDDTVRLLGVSLTEYAHACLRKSQIRER